MNKIIGKLSINSTNFGFVDYIDDNVSKGIFIKKQYFSNAINGDIVEVEIYKEATDSQKAEGKIIKIVERNEKPIIGRFVANKGYGFVITDSMKQDIFISKKYMNGAKTNDIVLIQIYFYGDKDKKPEGKVLKIINNPEDSKSLIDIMLLEEGISTKFYKEVNIYANNISRPNIDKEIKKRTDLRKHNTVTIDGIDTKDIDDAIYLEKRDGFYKLIVSIADVSHFVRQNDILDKDAKKRGNSIYLSDRVVPMLPKVLSNDLCSLNPHEDKLAFSVEIILDDSGKVINSNAYKSVINSKYQLNYDEVNELFDGKKIRIDNDTKKMLENMLELSKKIRKNKKQRGILDFELPEMKVELNEKGKVIDIHLRERGESHKLIEDFMVIANETVAEMLYWADMPAIYRIHEAPNMDSVKELIKSLDKFGYKLNVKKDIHPGKLQKIVDKSSESEEGFLIHKLILRAMQKARYSTDNLGHFGLSSQYYLHFTSPIRRYSDLIVHRMLDGLLVNRYNEKKKIKLIDELEKISQHISSTERIADRLENNSIKIKIVEYMKDKLGEEYIAKIVGVTANKIFIELDNYVETVFYPMDSKKEYEYIEEEMAYIDNSTKKRYTISDVVKVRIENINMMKYEVVVGLLEGDENGISKK